MGPTLISDFIKREMHVYLTHLPPHLRGRVEDTEKYMLQDIQEFSAIVQSGDVEKIRSHHFRNVETFFRLKFTLPLDTSVELIHGLIKYTFEHRPTLEFQIKALNVVLVLLKKTRKHYEGSTGAIKIDRSLALNVWEETYYKAPLPVYHDSDATISRFKSTLIKFMSKARPFYSEDATIWPKFASELARSQEEVSLKAAAQLSLTWPAHAASNDLINEWIQIWGRVNTVQEWDFHWLRLFARVVKNQQRSGSFTIAQWAPHLPFLFSKIQQILNLPSDLGAPPAKSKYPSVLHGWQGEKSSLYYASKMSVELLDSSLQTHKVLHQLLDLLTPFFHPSSAGNAANGISDYIYYLSAFLSVRLGSEKAQNRELVPYSTILDKLTQLCFLGIYSKSQNASSKSSFTLRNVININPLSATFIVTKLLQGLDPNAINQTHQAPSAISALTFCGPALLRGGISWADHFLPILQLTLPGIDPNDDGKTSRTLQLYTIWLMYLPIANDTVRPQSQRSALALDYSSKLNSQMFAPRDTSSELDNNLWRLGSSIESWMVLLMDRIFALLKNHDKPAAAKGVRSDDKFQIGPQTQGLLNQFFTQLSPELYAIALQRVVGFLQSTYLPHAGKAISGLVQAVTGGSIELAIKKLLEPAISTTLTSKSLSDQEILWQLRIIDGVVKRASGEYLLPIKDGLSKVLHFSIRHTNFKIGKLGCKILRHTLTRLTSQYQPDFGRSLPPDAWTEAGQTAFAHYIGASCSWGNVGIQWHEPSTAELLFASELLETYVEQACTALLSGTQGTESTSWRQLLRGVLHAVRGSKNVLLDHLGASNDRRPPLLGQPNDFLIEKLTEQESALKRILSLRALLFKTLGAVRSHWVNLVDPLQSKSLRYTIRILSLLLHPRDEANSGHTKMYARWFKMSARDVASAWLTRKLPKTDNTIPMWPRYVMQSRIQAVCSDYLNERSFQWSRNVRTNPQWYQDPEVYTRTTHGLSDLLSLSLHLDSKIRQEAQTVLDATLKRYTHWFESQLPSLIGIIRAAEDKAKVTGALHILQLQRPLRTVWKNWQTMQDLIVALLHASEPSGIENIEDRMKTQARVLKLFLSILNNVRDTKVVPSVGPILELEVQMQSHWRHRLMFLASFLPWIRVSSPLQKDLWPPVLRAIVSEIPQLQHFGRILLSRMLKTRLLLGSSSADDSPDGLFSVETLKALSRDMVLNHKSAARSADGQSHDSSPARWSLGVNELFQLVEKERFPPFLRSFGQKSADHINLHHIQLVYRIVALSKDKAQVLQVLETIVQELFQDESDERRASLCTAGEILVGAAQAVDPQQGEAFVLPLLQTILPKLSVPYAQDWYDILLLLSRNTPTKLDGLSGFILRELDLSFHSDTTTNGIDLVRWLVLAQPFLLVPDLTGYADKVASIVQEGLSHPYESVREQIGAILYKLCLVRESLPSIPLEFETEAAVSNEKELNARKSYLNLMATYIHFGDTTEFERLLPIFPIVFDTQAYPDPDIARSARGVIDTLSNKLQLQRIETFTNLLAILDKALSSPKTSWRTRGAVVRFLAIVNFRHGLLNWLKPDIEALIVSRFKDEKRDVQDIAQYAFRGFVRTLDESQVEAIATTFQQRAQEARLARVKKEKQIKRHRILTERNGPEHESAKKLKALLEEDDKPRNDQTVESCFGMAAIVLAYPTSVPQFVPALVEELTLHLHLKGNISYLREIVQTTLLEFKRTHQDSWHEDKLVFSPSQLEAIQDALISPSYYS